MSQSLADRIRDHIALSSYDPFTESDRALMAVVDECERIRTNAFPDDGADRIVMSHRILHVIARELGIDA